MREPIAKTVGALFIRPDGKVLLGLRAPTKKVWPNHWDTIGGRVEDGESLEQALVREVREETGVTPVEFRLIATVRERQPEIYGDARHHVYAVTRWQGGEPANVCDEHTEIKWFGIGDMRLLTNIVDSDYPRFAEQAMTNGKSAMTGPIEINLLSWEERASIHARDTTGDYMLDRFRAGEDSLHAVEAAELGDISGKRVLHLQCHIGRDTLSLARRGATVTGLDFSRTALDVARRLSEQTGIAADFVEGTVDQAPELTPGPFDLVFTTWGTICWLPDMTIWAGVIASVMAPGGELYFADAHPAFNVLEDFDGRLSPAHDFQTPADRPLQFVNETTYTGDPTILSHQSTREWIHSLSAVLGGLIDAGLTITMFREHDVLPWRGLPMLVPATDRLWRLPDGCPRIPLSYSLRAKKTA